MIGRPDHRHGLVVCRCGTVVFDCGCRLKLVASVQQCDACRGANELLERERAQLCGDAYPDTEVGAD